MPKCHFCGDSGKEGGCPKCGLTLRQSNHSRILPLKVATDLIPTAYQGVTWQRPAPPPGTELPLVFKQVDEAMEKVYTKYLKGELPAFSMFLSAPPKSGKNLFAYACMQTAIAHDYTVAPLLSTADWRRLHKVSQVNPLYKLYGKYQWDKLIVSDVLFLFVDHTDDHNDDIPLLKSIYDIRSSFSLPTTVLSDYRLNDLVPKWRSEAYGTIYNSNPKRDYMRYPVVLHRFE